MDDFIEFPELILPALDRGAQPDLKILLDDGKSVNEVCSVHLRAMSMPSDFFYMLAVTGDSSEVQTDPPNRPTSDSPRSGDINLKLHDGSCFRMGSLTRPLSAFKEQVLESLGVALYDQILLRPDGRELGDDWRSLADLGLKKDDALLLVQRQPWQRYDPSSKTLTLHLPDDCARRVPPTSAIPFYLRAIQRQGAAHFRLDFSCVAFPPRRDFLPLKR
jgi:hypothetical protein